MKRLITITLFLAHCAVSQVCNPNIGMLDWAGGANGTAITLQALTNSLHGSLAAFTIQSASPNLMTCTNNPMWLNGKVDLCSGGFLNGSNGVGFCVGGNMLDNQVLFIYPTNGGGSAGPNTSCTIASVGYWTMTDLPTENPLGGGGNGQQHDMVFLKGQQVGFAGPGDFVNPYINNRNDRSPCSGLSWFGLESARLSPTTPVCCYTPGQWVWVTAQMHFAESNRFSVYQTNAFGTFILLGHIEGQHDGLSYPNSIQLRYQTGDSGTTTYWGGLIWDFNTGQYPLLPHVNPIYAKSNGYADVSNAVAQAWPGDTVVLTAGTTNWDSTLLIVTNISLVSTGSTSISFTNIGPLISLTTDGTTNVQTIKGFTFTDSTNDTQGVISHNGTYYWRICSNTFMMFAAVGIWANGQSNYAVIDHNIFLPMTNSAFAGVLTNFAGNYVAVRAIADAGTNSWNYGPSWGGTNKLYVENNSFFYNGFSGDEVMDTYSGADWVFRFNFVTNCTGPGWHGTDSGGLRSTHTVEIYNNTYVVQSNYYGGAIAGDEIRGGTALIYSNSFLVASNINNVPNWTLMCFRVNNGFSYVPWGMVTGTNTYDGNTDAGGYPAFDQGGQSGPTTFFSTHTTQALSPIYGWSNTYNGTLTKMIKGGTSANTWGGDGEPLLFVEGRNYTNDFPIPGYAPLVFPHPLAGGVAAPQSSSVSSLSLNSATLQLNGATMQLPQQ